MNKREQLAAMRIEDFKTHLRTIVGEDPKAAITGAPRPNPCLWAIARRERGCKSEGGVDEGRSR
jgi:hypothetical protein